MQMTPSIASSSTQAHSLETWAFQRLQQLEKGDPVKALETVFADLWMLRRSLDAAAWQSAVSQLRHTSLVKSLLQDPFSQHAQERPRGYPGDAPLLDRIYNGGEHPSQPPPGTFAATVNSYAVQRASCAAVRWRKDHLAARLGELPPEARVLSLACGHLREVSTAVGHGRQVPQVYGLDQDPLSLEEARTTLADQPVHTLQAGVKELLTGELPSELRDLDLAYSAGLYDYLNQKLATAVSTRLFERVRVGGTVLVANFVPDVPDVGYMEVVMDWMLIYRTEEELAATFAPVADRAELKTWTGPFGNIAYVTATRLA